MIQAAIVGRDYRDCGFFVLLYPLAWTERIMRLWKLEKEIFLYRIFARLQRDLDIFNLLNSALICHINTCQSRIYNS